MNSSQAFQVFSLYGVDAPSLTPDRLKAEYRRIAKMLHPDHGGNEAAMQQLNAAYDCLRTIPADEADEVVGEAEWEPDEPEPAATQWDAAARRAAEERETQDRLLRERQARAQQ